MYRQQKIALVLTTFNEQRLIGATLEAVPEIIDHVYVVDDASQDQTRQIVLDHARQDPRIQLLVHDKNQGVGQVIITGYSHSSKDEYDITVVAGGDHQMP
jgi:glycosyltransferase involved in cell wall biosynthesis